jgi:SET domain-containing protein
MSGLEVRRVPGMGRGVFAQRHFKKGSIVELCPVVPLPIEHYKLVSKSVLGDYVFTWPGPRQRTKRYYAWTGSCVVLGYGSLYNHSPKPNLTWTARIQAREMVFWARRDIEPDEHLTHDYGWADHLVEGFCYLDRSPAALNGASANGQNGRSFRSHVRAKAQQPAGDAAVE